MKTLVHVVLGLFCLPLLLNAQDEENTEPYGMVELTYMHAKQGMDKKFIDAVRQHNDKYHPEGNYQAGLWRIETGNEAGTYVWSMGGLSYTDLDGAPGEGDHQEDWAKTVEPYVAEYGRVEYWRYSDKFSTPDDEAEAMQQVWFMDLKWGEYYRFQAFMEKVHEIHVESGEEFHLWMNEFSGANKRDIAFTWPFDKWAELDDDDFNMMKAYNEKYGPGSWMNAMKEWDAFMEELNQEVWRRL
jgi:hypothetical protein